MEFGVVFWWFGAIFFIISECKRFNNPDFNDNWHFFIAAKSFGMEDLFCN
jgi:hypothetical protein